MKFLTTNLTLLLTLIVSATFAQKTKTYQLTSPDGNKRYKD